MKERELALNAISKLLQSKTTSFDAGNNSLQAIRARTVESCLRLVVHNGHTLTTASVTAAEAHGLSSNYGSRSVRKWSMMWIKDRELSVSEQGSHAKTYTLFSDPVATDPQKLQKFINNKLLPDVAKDYGKRVIGPEMAMGSQRYLEVLFPCIHYKSKKGISVKMAELMDGRKKSWGPADEQPLRKKGIGHGMHQSEVICSTVGWILEAGQSLEYGKNYEGYWTGELLCKQLQEKIIPAFKRIHGAGYRAVFLIENSQGHSAYAVNALLTSLMNLNPGGKQALMWDGWFIKDGVCISQPMIFPSDHTTHPSLPKGMKKYLWDMCDYTFDTLKSNLPTAMESVSLQTIWRWEHRVMRWINAYRDGLDAKDAQKKVKDFSSRHFKSHRRVTETMGRLIDQ
ncbi:hypothetical protein L218DRAFT_974626 [Marasmius fiardii PR-910]|nr:hypothetical protein L218DRAFT_974626 [Marasmius fiardii PR-910]